MKNKNKILRYWIFSIIVCFLPLFLASIYNIVNKIPVMRNLKDTEFLLALLPIAFSIVLIINNRRIEYEKECNELERQEIEKINVIVEKYNTIMLKSITNYTIVMNELDLLYKILMELKNAPLFCDIINEWEKETKKTKDLSNDSIFRAFLRTNIGKIVVGFKNSSIFDHNLEFLRNLDALFLNYYTYSIYDRVFVFNLRNYIHFTKEEKNILCVHLDVFSNGEFYTRACTELVIAIKNINNVFENEIRQKTIDERKLHSLLYHLFLKIFNKWECLLREVYFNECFEGILVNNFNEFYNSKTNQDSLKLNECISIEPVIKNDFVDNYLNKQLICDFYHIKEDPFRTIRKN
jgi:hypothetical protein